MSELELDKSHILEAENQILRDKLATLESAYHRLSQQTNILHLIVDQLPLMVLVSDANGNMEFLNRASQETLGWTLEELKRQTPALLSDIWSAETSRQNSTPESSSSGDATAWFNCHVPTKDAPPLNTIWAKIQLRDGHRLAVGQDITARKQVEQSLRNSEEFFRQLAENARLIFFVYDIQSDRVLYASPIYEAVWEQTAECLYRDIRSAFQSVHPDDWAKFYAIHESQRTAPANLEYQYRLLCPSGAIKWIAERHFTVADEQGHISRLVGISEDITERKRADEMLLRTRAYLAEAERLSHIGSWCYSLASRQILFWSEEHFRIFGFDPTAGIPPFSELIERMHPDDMDALSAFEYAIAHKTEHEARYRIILPDGTVRHILSIGHPTANDSDEIVEFIGVAMDITDQQKAEENIQNSFAQLRALAAQLERVREEEGRKIARELHDELGSALSSLKWDVEELDNVILESSNRLGVNALHSRFQRMGALTDRTIQTVKRISSELRPVILDDLGIIEAIEWQCQEFGTRTGIECRFDVTPDCPDFNREHSSAIFRIVQEALTNILRHAQATKVSIHFERRDAEWVLMIVDDGRGTSPERLTSSRSLGIMGMRERAHLLGGTIEFHSRMGVGLEVAVHIPIDQSQDGSVKSSC